MYEPSKLFVDTDKKEDIWSLDALISWLETKLPSKQYCFVDSRNCLLTQYLKSRGMTNLDYEGRIYTINGHRHTVPCEFWEIANGGTIMDTFGEALARARTVKAQHTAQSAVL